MSLVNYLVSIGYLKTPKIIEAFSNIKRADFLPEDLKDLCDIDEALPIGFGQTISQPSVVAFMLELLSPEEGDKILDVGSGSGWTTALLAYCVSSKRNSKKGGKVVAIERIPELKSFGEKNVAKYNFIEKGKVEFVLGDGSKGYLKEAPFDKILVSASADSPPEALKKQLKIGGRLVIPILNSIWLLEKKSEKEFKVHKFPGFVFVPLIED